MCTPSTESNRDGRFLIFNLGARVCASHALQDKVELSFELGHLPYDEDFPLFIRRLCVPPEEERESLESFHSYGMYFNRPQRTDNRCRMLKIRTMRLNLRNGTSIPRPHFSGRINLNHLQGRAQTYLRADLSLNPSRYIRHIDPRYNSHELAEGATETFSPTQNPQLFRSSPAAGGEIALSRWDNWIPRGRRWRMMASPSCWRRHLESYFDGVHQLLQREIRDAAEQASLPFTPASPRRRVSVKRVETYWEFADESAIRTMHELTAHMRSLPEVKITAYGDSSPEGGHFPSISFQIRGGETLTLYAKTNCRIRIEVEHFLAGEAGFQAAGAHTFEDCSEAVDFFGELAQQAANTVNEFLFRLDRITSFSTTRTPLDLLCQLAMVCGDDHQKAQELLYLLLGGEGVHPDRESQIMLSYGPQLTELESRDVLVRFNNWYLPTGEYQAALRILRDLPNRYELTERIHRRVPSFSSYSTSP